MTNVNRNLCGCGAACACSPCLCDTAPANAGPVTGCPCGATCDCGPTCTCGA